MGHLLLIMTLHCIAASLWTRYYPNHYKSSVGTRGLHTFDVQFIVRLTCRWRISRPRVSCRGCRSGGSRRGRGRSRWRPPRWWTRWPGRGRARPGWGWPWPGWGAHRWTPPRGRTPGSLTSGWRPARCSVCTPWSLLQMVDGNQISYVYCWLLKYTSFSCNPLSSVERINFMSLQFIVKCKEILRA